MRVANARVLSSLFALFTRVLALGVLLRYRVFEPRTAHCTGIIMMITATIQSALRGPHWPNGSTEP